MGNAIKKINDPQQHCIRFFNTDLGRLALIWSEFKRQPGIIRILTPRPSLSVEQRAADSFQGCRVASCKEIDHLAKRICAFLAGSDIRFSLDMIRLDLCSAFQQSVLRADHAIPRGRVSTYGCIAGYIGQPGAARAVGTALATNPFPIVVPCHRVLRSNGHLGGFGGGLAMKKALLAMEGIEFKSTTDVATKHFYYQVQL